MDQMEPQVERPELLNLVDHFDTRQFLSCDVKLSCYYAEREYFKSAGKVGGNRASYFRGDHIGGRFAGWKIVLQAQSVVESLLI